MILAISLVLDSTDSTGENTQLSGNPWLTDYSSAVSESKKTGRHILIYFTGSDWCAPCRKLKQDLFETEAFKALSPDYVLLYVDIPVKKELISSTQMVHNKALLSKFNKKGVFPLLKVLTSGEKELAEVAGYDMNGEIDRYLNLLRQNRE